MENKFDVIVHQMILHQPCSLQEYVSSIAAQHPLSTTCKQQPPHLIFLAKVNPVKQLEDTNACKAVREHGTGDHLIAHTASPIFSKWERRTTQFLLPGHPRDPYPKDVAITIGCSMLYEEWVLLPFSPLHLIGKSRNPPLQGASS